MKRFIGPPRLGRAFVGEDIRMLVADQIAPEPPVGQEIVELGPALPVELSVLRLWID